MRIISQDKKIDLPYGETTLQALGVGGCQYERYEIWERGVKL